MNKKIIKKLPVLFSALCIFCMPLFGAPNSVEQDIKGHLFVYGGDTITPQLAEQYVTFAGGQGAKILIVPLAGTSPETEGKRWIEPFRNAGAVADYIVFRKGEADSPDNLKKLDGVTGIWFSGDDPTLLTRALFGTTFLERIKQIYRQGGVVGGANAGAIALCGIMFTEKDAKNTDQRERFPAIKRGGIAVDEGFGFIDFAVVDHHFLQNRRQNRLTELVIEYNLPGIGIDDSTAIVFSGGSRMFDVIGEYTVSVFEPRITTAPRVDSRNNLSTDVIDLKILLSGDHHTVVHRNFIGMITGFNRNVCPASTVNLSIKAVESDTFQWYKDGTPIKGAISNTYTATESGIYTVSFGAGRTSPPKEVTIFPLCLTYEDFLGTYILRYSTDRNDSTHSNPGTTHRMPVTLVPAVYGETYYLKGVLNNRDEGQGAIEVLFDPQNGITIPGNRELFLRRRNQHFWMVAIRPDGTNTRTSSLNAGVKGTDYTIVDGRLRFNTTCRGMARGPIIGFLFRNFQNNETTNTVNIDHRGRDHRLYYLKFEKQ